MAWKIKILSKAHPLCWTCSVVLKRNRTHTEVAAKHSTNDKFIEFYLIRIRSLQKTETKMIMRKKRKMEVRESIRMMGMALTITKKKKIYRSV